MLKTNRKNFFNSNIGILSILIITFVDNLGNGVSNIILPLILDNLGKGSAWLGTIMGIQSFVGIFIFLPQATFIKKFGEKFCIGLSMIINIIVYICYLFNQLGLIAFGKFIEGFADRLMNSSISKVVYDETDGKNNRGRIRAFIDSIGLVGRIIGPAIAAYLITYSFNAPILLSIILMIIAFFLSNKLSISNYSNSDIDEKEYKNLKIQNIFQTYYFEHLKNYFKNKFIVYVTIPSILFSCLDIFYSILLNLYLLKYKGFTYYQIAFLWSTISIINVLFQVPFGLLADKKKEISFTLSIILNGIGFGILISTTNSFFLVIISVLLINIGCMIYTTAMSALFGDLTTIENRLSESESYRMIRAIGEGILSIILSIIFDINPILSLLIIGIFVVIGSFITLIINEKFKEKRN